MGANVQPKGVTIQYKYFPVFTDMLTALNAGQIDLTEIGDVGAVQSLVNGGGKVQAIAVSQPNSLNCGLIVPKGSPAKTFADLKGKKIIFLRSTNSYIAFLHQLKAAHLKESDFQVTEIGGPAANAAFTSGQVAAYYSIDPNLADIVHRTEARVISTCKQAGVQNVYPYVATTSAIKNKSAALHTVVQAIADNFVWIKNHPNEQASLLSAKLGFGEPAIRVTYKRGAQGLQRVTPAWLASRAEGHQRARRGEDRRQAGYRPARCSCRRSTTRSLPAGRANDERDGPRRGRRAGDRLRRGGDHRRRAVRGCDSGGGRTSVTAGGACPTREILELAHTGLLAMRIPASHGGAGVSSATVAEVFRLISAADPAIGQIPQNHIQFVDTFIRFGSDEQRSSSCPGPARRTFRQRAVRARRHDRARLDHAPRAPARRRLSPTTAASTTRPVR